MGLVSDSTMSVRAVCILEELIFLLRTPCALYAVLQMKHTVSSLSRTIGHLFHLHRQGYPFPIGALIMHHTCFSSKDRFHAKWEKPRYEYIGLRELAGPGIFSAGFKLFESIYSHEAVAPFSFLLAVAQ